MRGLRLHGRELGRGPRREAGVGKLRPEAGRRIQGHAADRALLDACCVARRARGSRCERNCGDCGLGAQARPVSIRLARGQGLFCSPSAGPLSPAPVEILYTPNFEGYIYKADGGGERITSLRGLLSAESGVGLPGFTSWLPQFQAVTLDLSETLFLHLQNGGVKLISSTPPTPPRSCFL